MTDKFKEIIKEEVSKLPMEAQEAINGFDWVKITEEIGEKFSFKEDEINNFQAETLIILVGIETIDSYAQNLEKNIRTSKENAEKISSEVIEKIFKPIKKLVEENVKKNMKNKEINWQQSVDFILSGGDYSTFMTRNRGQNLINTGKTDKIIGSSNILETKSKLIN
jgi:hypothetical protein